MCSILGNFLVSCCFELGNFDVIQDVNTFINTVLECIISLLLVTTQKNVAWTDPICQM